MSLDRVQRRALALDAAITFAVRSDRRHVLEAADAFDAWLTQPPPIVTATLVADAPIDRNRPQENPVSMAMPDTKKVTVRARAEDAEGVMVPDDFTDAAGPFLAPFTWVLDSTTVGQMTVAEDTLSADVESVPGQVGTITLVATDVNGKSLPPFTIEIDPSAAVSASLVADTPVDRTDAPAPTA